MLSPAILASPGTSTRVIGPLKSSVPERGITVALAALVSLAVPAELRISVRPRHAANAGVSATSGVLNVRNSQGLCINAEGWG